LHEPHKSGLREGFIGGDRRKRWQPPVTEERSGKMMEMAERKGRELDLEAVEAEIDRALESEDPGPETKHATVVALGRKIDLLRTKKKKTWAEITALFDVGGGISKDTLRHAFSEYKKQQAADVGEPLVKPQAKSRLSAVSTPGKKSAGSGGHGSAHDIGG
jgi:hypothetical protein